MPEMARRIGLIASAHAFLEYQFGFLYSKLMGTEIKAAAATFMALVGSNARRDALNAVAESKLNDEDLKLFRAIAAIARSVGTRRNAVVHGLIGSCPEIPDAILVLEDADLLGFHANAEGRIAMHRDDKKVGFLTFPALNHETIFVYKAEELDRLRQDIVQARGNFIRFVRILDATTQPEREELRRELATQPDVVRLATPQQNG